MTDAVDTAYYMINAANISKMTMTNLKLQKLVYIAHGYMLAINNQPLINTAPQAWRYRPVIHSIYQQFKNYADKQVTINTSAINKSTLTDEKKRLLTMS